MNLTSDYITVTDHDTAKQIVNEYLTACELTLSVSNKYGDSGIYITGDWIFAVEHESNSEDGHTMGEPVNNLDFLADVARIATEGAFPFKVTEITQGTLDTHPGITKYKVTRDTITMRTGTGETKRWEVANHGIITL